MTNVPHQGANPVDIPFGPFSTRALDVLENDRASIPPVPAAATLTADELLHPAVELDFALTTKDKPALEYFLELHEKTCGLIQRAIKHASGIYLSTGELAKISQDVWTVMGATCLAYVVHELGAIPRLIACELGRGDSQNSVTDTVLGFEKIVEQWKGLAGKSKILDAQFRKLANVLRFLPEGAAEKVSNLLIGIFDWDAARATTSARLLVDATAGGADTSDQ